MATRSVRCRCVGIVVIFVTTEEERRRQHRQGERKCEPVVTHHAKRDAYMCVQEILSSIKQTGQVKEPASVVDPPARALIHD
jgi:hypothetical protein